MCCAIVLTCLGLPQIDNFERKQGLHGPGYMTRKVTPMLSRHRHGCLRTGPRTLRCGNRARVLAALHLCTTRALVQELRMKLRGTEEYNLGVDLKRASKEELVAAYNQYQQMMKDGIIDKAEHKRKKAARLTESLRLQELSANSVHSVDPADNVSAEATAKMQRSLELGRHAAPPPASGKPLQFNVRYVAHLSAPSTAPRLACCFGARAHRCCNSTPLPGRTTPALCSV